MTQTLLNARGEPPAPEYVQLVARQSQSLEDSTTESIPPIVIPVLTEFLTHNPGDTNFLLELGNPNDPTQGGNGFGLVTCMEDNCWSDLLLTADPDRPDGGRAEGLGSFYEFTVHCADEHHAKARKSRMEQQNIVIPASGKMDSTTPPPSRSPRAPMAPLPMDFGNREPISSGFANAAAGPSRLGAPSSMKPDIKPHTSQTSRHRAGHSSAYIVNDDDSDDEITFMGVGSTNTNRPKIVEVKDDGSASDDDIKPITPSQYKASVKPAHVTAWVAMSLPDRMQAVKTELEELRKLNPASSDTKATIKLRRADLKIIEKSFGIKQWTPPAQSILQILPKAAINDRLRATFDWPDPPAPVAPVSIPVPQLPPHQVSYLEATQMWRRLDKITRIQTSHTEQLYLSNLLTSAAKVLNGIPVLKGMLTSRVLECVRRIQNPDLVAWTPPPHVLLQYFPHLRSIFPPVMQRFLAPAGGAAPFAAHGYSLPPAGVPGTYNHLVPMAFLAGGSGMPGAPGMPGAFPGADMDDFGVELDRPQTQQGLADFFQEALEDFKEDATVDDALKVLKLETLEDKLPGANFTLMPHQVLGVAFMVKREERKSVRGGLLCDSMGLGKTVQTLGIMLARNQRPNDYKKAPQLIVAPVALLAQWKAEIESKTTENWKVHIHHGASRAKTSAALKQHDIILTSYGTLRSEAFPNGRKKKKSQSRTPNGSNPASDDDSDSDGPNLKAPLLQIKWYRVILDEAHNIRNKATSTCKACIGLDVLHPWYLTGTPVVNSLKDLAPALRFIGAMDYESFNTRVGKVQKNKPKLAAKRSQAILRPLIMRRNKESKINGVHILNLPPKTTNLASLDFEPDERAIYAALEARAQMQVNKFIKEGTLMKNYSVVLVLLTRLRQCVNHPWLLRRKPGEERDMNDTLVVSDELLTGDITQCCKNDADEYGRAVGLLGRPVVDTIKRKLEERYQRMTNESLSVEDQDMECSICYEPFDGTELITSCQHIYCKGCLDNLFTQPIRDATQLSEDQAGRGCRVCPLCRGVMERGRIFRTAALYQPPKEPEAQEEQQDEDVKPGPSDRKGKKRAAPGGISDFFGKKLKIDDGGVADDDVEELDIEEQIPKSTKMKKLLQLVQGYVAEDKTVKIIVFSQFVAFLDLLSDFLNVHGIKNIGYRGSMNQSERSEAIRRFSMPSAIADSISVMLISTKAGGVGLNLTMASKVICCDLAWNPATENQAVDRAHRIGQTRPVAVERLVIKDTVEDRLLEIQAHKGLLADGAMGEGSISKLGRLTLENIRRLFAIDSEFEGED